MDPNTGTSLTSNDLLALGTWVLLFGVSTVASLGNARKNAGKPLAEVWYAMTALCGYWLLCGILGLMGGPFVLLYRLGILFAAFALLVLYLRGSFKG